MSPLNESTSREHALPLAVVTVTYSPGAYLDRFLTLLAAATDRETLTVLADNGSRDGVPERAGKRPGVTFLPTGGNVGYGGGMNAGERYLRAARNRGEVGADYLLLSNPDVEFTPGSIDALIDCLERHPEAAAAGPRIVEPDGSTYPSAREVPTLRDGIGHAVFSRLWPQNPWTARYRRGEDMDTERTAGWLSGSCLLLRWDAFAAIGGFDERYFMYLEDVDLGDRLQRAGYTNVYCPAARISHAQGHSTKAHAGPMLKAHHASAYRFQADRHPKWWQAPLRWALRAGLKARLVLERLAGSR